MGGTGVGAIIMGLTPTTVADATMSESDYNPNAKPLPGASSGDYSEATGVFTEMRRPTPAQMEKTLAEAGRAKPGPGYSPHHIVPIFGFKKLQNGLVTDGLRSLLSANNIGINSAENIIWLPNHDAARIPGDISILHGVGHRFNTLLGVNQRIQIGAAAGGSLGISAALFSIRADFNAGIIY